MLATVQISAVLLWLSCDRVGREMCGGLSRATCLPALADPSPAPSSSLQGKAGQLLGRTFSAPKKWLPGKGRMTIQFGGWLQSWVGTCRFGVAAWCFPD